MKVVVKKEHPLTKELFPIGFETTCKPLLSKEEKVSKGFWTQIKTVGDDRMFVNTSVYVEPKVTPKGAHLGCILIGSNGGEYNADWFYRTTGRSFSEFFNKVE